MNFIATKSLSSIRLFLNKASIRLSSIRLLSISLFLTKTSIRLSSIGLIPNKTSIRLSSICLFLNKTSIRLASIGLIPNKMSIRLSSICLLSLSLKAAQTHLRHPDLYLHTWLQRRICCFCVSFRQEVERLI